MSHFDSVSLIVMFEEVTVKLVIDPSCHSELSTINIGCKLVFLAGAVFLTCKNNWKKNLESGSKTGPRKYPASGNDIDHKFEIPPLRLVLCCWQMKVCAGYKLTPCRNSSTVFHIRCGPCVLTVMAQSLMLGAVLDVRRATQVVWSGCAPLQSLHAQICANPVWLTRLGGGTTSREITIWTGFAHGVTFWCTCKTFHKKVFWFQTNIMDSSHVLPFSNKKTWKKPALSLHSYSFNLFTFFSLKPQASFFKILCVQSSLSLQYWNERKILYSLRWTVWTSHHPTWWW